MDYVKTLKDIAIELVEDKEHLEVRQMPSLDERCCCFTCLFSKK